MKSPVMEPLRFPDGVLAVASLLSLAALVVLVRWATESCIASVVAGVVGGVYVVARAALASLRGRVP